MVSCCSLLVAHSMNCVSLITEKALDGFFSNLNHTLVMIAPWIVRLFKVVGQRWWFWSFFWGGGGGGAWVRISVGDICCHERQHILDYFNGCTSSWISNFSAWQLLFCCIFLSVVDLCSSSMTNDCDELSTVCMSDNGQFVCYCRPGFIPHLDLKTICEGECFVKHSITIEPEYYSDVTWTLTHWPLGNLNEILDM